VRSTRPVFAGRRQAARSQPASRAVRQGDVFQGSKSGILVLPFFKAAKYPGLPMPTQLAVDFLPPKTMQNSDDSCRDGANCSANLDFNNHGAGSTDSALEVRGFVHSVESLGSVDGPGIRFIIFTSGCSLRCQYCHNPDTAYVRRGTSRSVGELVEELRNYVGFLQASGGGVTISGGDPLYQINFTRQLLRACKQLGLHTALDTSGNLGSRVDAAMLEDIDLVLLDIKSFDDATHRKVTKVSVKPTLDFAERLCANNKAVWLRFVLVPGLTDDEQNLRDLAAYVAKMPNIERIDILPFHKMGEYKWQELGLEYQLKDTPEPTAEQVSFAKQIFMQAGIAAERIF